MELSLQHLESFSVEVTGLDDIDDLPVIINAVTLPALSSLSIGMPRREGINRSGRYMTGVTQFTTSFLSLIARSKSRSTSTIERLQLNCFPFRCDELIALMEKLPNLLELSISEPDWAETDLQSGRNQMLTCDVLEELARGRILPRLKNLRMVVNNDWVGSDAFERMIESRPRLDSVDLGIAAQIVLNLNIPRLRQLQQGQPGQALRIVQDVLGKQIELLGYGKGSSVDGEA
ncbi:hypothetical protein Moror_3781 [Moniliophthora roreri MCA 2997]|uniref:Uncharacterized protein n=1 Tax=Moniliophthora roreri (strain MCA 2997) TaxID=1381753 RepID=V2XXX6_MONRO|nr:hypothetical protein Moror_3781 [Moniliophthora roreri MCA 2997]